MKTVMILGGSASEVPVIQRALEMEHRVVLVDRDEHSPGFKESVIAEYHSIADKEKVLELARKYSVDGIVSSVDAGVRPAAYACRILGLPGISEEAAFMGTDKVAMRIRLKERGVPVPEFYIVKTKEEYLDAVAKFEDTCIVKAADSSGSRGIYKLNDLADRADIDYAYDYCREFSSTGELLIEEFMVGPEICAETLSSKGVCYPIQISDQLHKEPPYFTDCGYSQPCMLDPAVVEEIRRIAIDANLAIENYQGSSCTEMIITKDGPKVVELGARLAGDFMTTAMVPLSCGVDMPGDVVRIALGEDIDPTHRFSKGSCVRYFMKERVGTIKQIVGVEEAKQLEGVWRVEILKGVGEEATPLRKSSDRLGLVIAQGKDAEDAIRIADKALGMIDFIVE